MITSKLNKQPILLASGSPRRKQLLEQAGLIFNVVKPNVEENHPEGVESKNIPVFLAEKKINEVVKTYPNHIIIAADTVVIHNGVILEKPKNTKEAFNMLSKLAGDTHKVVTGVAFNYKSKVYSFSEETTVFFKSLSPEEITYYINEYKPFDKAGAYGIQEWIGLIGIEKISGCYYNVMGLPVQTLLSKIQEL